MIERNVRGIERNVCYAGSAVLVHEMTSFRVGVCIDFGHFANCQGGVLTNLLQDAHLSS